MTGTNCDLFTHKSSRSYLNHLVLKNVAPSAQKTLSSWLLDPKKESSAILRNVSKYFSVDRASYSTRLDSNSTAARTSNVV